MVYTRAFEVEVTLATSNFFLLTQHLPSVPRPNHSQGF